MPLRRAELGTPFKRHRITQLSQGRLPRKMKQEALTNLEGVPKIFTDRNFASRPQNQSINSLITNSLQRNRFRFSQIFANLATDLQCHHRHKRNFCFKTLIECHRSEVFLPSLARGRHPGRSSERWRGNLTRACFLQGDVDPKVVGRDDKGEIWEGNVIEIVRALVAAFMACATKARNTDGTVGNFLGLLQVRTNRFESFLIT